MTIIVTKIPIPYSSHMEYQMRFFWQQWRENHYYIEGRQAVLDDWRKGRLSILLTQEEISKAREEADRHIKKSNTRELADELLNDGWHIKGR